MVDRDSLLRYSRHLLLDDVGELGQARLGQARVAVVGVGGLGCPAATYLAAAGVGQITLIDGDNVDVSNLQRQFLFADADRGRPKADVAAHWLRSLNPSITIKAVQAFANASLPEEILSNQDIVVDCTDNLESRRFLNQLCHREGLVLCTAAAIRWEGQLSVYDFRHSASPCYECLWVGKEEPELNCQSAGVIGPVLGMLGSAQAMEVMKIILQIESDACGVLKVFDGKRGQWMNLSLKGRADCPVCGQ